MRSLRLTKSDPIAEPVAVVDARTEQLTLAGNDLKPYAPAQLGATGSWGSNVTLSWQRRTRVGGELIDGSSEVPLAEDTEEYELEILGGPGGAVLHTEAGITTISLTYTSGMQSADFGSAQVLGKRARADALAIGALPRRVLGRDREKAPRLLRITAPSSNARMICGALV